ncbi:hypothetical protein IT072_02715 [Leifsonia sp. ZF2019]|uniref:hypothetical protein n=1 Tax=Leifsonia sp. ZF2019 TaxID=2781978 RepID=UPI001CBF13E9|nr:hypothetical protein [Leifsonia sp. ZF2019]UAJ80007.1 hypothetical protein IT072_02715 [Leifsonia sp. ZF2019]
MSASAHSEQRPPRVPSVLRLTADQLETTAPAAAVPDRHYTALLVGPAGSGSQRFVSVLDSERPHDLIVVDFGGGHSRSWLRHGSSATEVVYTFLVETPTVFPGREHALAL